MFVQVLIVTFVLCLGLTVATVLVSRQLLSTYASEFLRHHFYYLAAVHAFAFYGLWGQILTRAVLGVVDTDAAAVNLVAVFVPLLGVPFLFVSWAMLVNMAGSMFGKPIKPAWHSAHIAVFGLLLVGVWAAVGRLQAEPASPLDVLGLVEAAAMIGVELLYFVAFLVIVWRSRVVAEGDRRRVLLVFSALLCGAFVARSLLAALVLLDIRLGVVALLAFHGSNLPALLYLRASADRLFAPVKAEHATKQGMDHVLDRYGITKRERQIVQKVCLGKTNKQIAEELFISLQTVKDHTHRIYSKIGVNSRMQLVQMMNIAK
ncbi:MAG TPA: LuxR C-terminal-related transcriptional regulator [Gammaproteobacteria bacterium]|nr:LuxR C-terminal-related transcriptional regulator [Gammaproteobacteria bacterium]